MKESKYKIVPQKIMVDYKRLGYIFIGERKENTITIYKTDDLAMAMKVLNNNPMCIFIQSGTAKKLGVL